MGRKNAQLRSAQRIESVAHGDGYCAARNRPPPGFHAAYAEHAATGQHDREFVKLQRFFHN
jgi:hypothetical protein